MDFEKKLQGLMTLEDPGIGFPDKVIASMRARIRKRTRAHGRLIVFGLVAVGLAAASMLGWRFNLPREQLAVAEVSVPDTSLVASPDAELGIQPAGPAPAI